MTAGGASPIDRRGAPSATEEAAGRDDARMRQAAAEFEGLLLAHLLKTMRGRASERGLFAPSESERLWREMHDEEMGRAMAQKGGIGLASLLVETLRSRRPEVR